MSKPTIKEIRQARYVIGAKVENMAKDMDELTDLPMTRPDRMHFKYGCLLQEYAQLKAQIEAEKA